MFLRFNDLVDRARKKVITCANICKNSNIKQGKKYFEGPIGLKSGVLSTVPLGIAAEKSKILSFHDFAHWLLCK